MAKVAANLANPRPMLARLTLLAPVLLLTACAAAMPGYTPPSFKAKSRIGQPQESGVVRGGRYEMSEAEKGLGCKRLTGAMQIAIARLKDGRGRDQQSGVSSTMQTVLPSIFGGSTAGAEREADDARERAKIEAYNRHLASKNCRTIDIEAELARPPEGPKRY
jgi:hypothetical protein